MSDDDLSYLLNVLNRMDGGTEIQIGLCYFRAGEIAEIAEQAFMLREQAKVSFENSRPYPR